MNDEVHDEFLQDSHDVSDSSPSLHDDEYNFSYNYNPYEGIGEPPMGTITEELSDRTENEYPVWPIADQADSWNYNYVEPRAYPVIYNK